MAPVDISNSPQVLSRKSIVSTNEDAPIKFIMPGLNITADIEAVGTHPSGVLAQPDNKLAIGWYRAGGYPGSKRPILLSGYHDSDNSPLFRTANLRVHDLVEIRNQKGDSYWYNISSIDFYAAKAVPMHELLSEKKGENLVIIVNSGDKQGDNYPERTVIVAEHQN